jgi:hypothetical protein
MQLSNISRLSVGRLRCSCHLNTWCSSWYKFAFCVASCFEGDNGCDSFGREKQRWLIHMLTYLDIFLFGVEWNRVHYYWGHYWPTAPALDHDVDDEDNDDDDDDECGAIGGMLDRGNRSTLKKPAPVLLCLSKNPKWPGPVSNPGRRGGKQAAKKGSVISMIIYNIPNNCIQLKSYKICSKTLPSNSCFFYKFLPAHRVAWASVFSNVVFLFLIKAEFSTRRAQQLDNWSLNV